MALDNLGDRLREARLEKGLTLEQVAEQVGVRLNTIWCYEKGKFRPSEPVLKLCSQIYNKPVEWFFGEEEEPEATSEDPEEDDIEIMDPSLRLFFRGEWDEFTEAEKEFVKGMIRQSRDLLRKRREAGG